MILILDRCWTSKLHFLKFGHVWIDTTSVTHKPTILVFGPETSVAALSTVLLFFAVSDLERTRVESDLSIFLPNSNDPNYALRIVGLQN